MNTLRNNQGLYFVTGSGFVARNQAEATKIAPGDTTATINCLRSAGIKGDIISEAVKVEVDPNIKQNSDGSSFAVLFVRQKDVRSDGSVVAHRNNPTKRRFGTYDEAVAHGNRFMKIEKHAGFHVQKRYERVNAYVNKLTGKTNPVVGKGRTNR